MITIRPSAERGDARHGWLHSRHTFSFADYYDPSNMGFRALRVINEDIVQPGQGFGTHAHRDMEIVTYVLEGALEHKDSLGTGSIIRPGDGQRMSAGTGIRHSEYNASSTEPVHFLQIWILPEKSGLKPGYEQKSFPEAEKQGKLRALGSRDGRNGSVTIHQDVVLYSSILGKGESVEYDLPPGRHAWLQVTRGSVKLNGKELREGDGAAVSEENKLIIAGSGADKAEVLLFDLA